MRIWDVSPSVLCRNHLLGEHRELHAIWSVITNDRKGYSRHPEVMRWRGKLKALRKRHEMLVAEMRKRGYEHRSPIDKNIASGSEKQDIYIDIPERQIEILKAKGCGCRIS